MNVTYLRKLLSNLLLYMMISLKIAMMKHLTVNTVCNCRSRYCKFVYFNRPRTHVDRVRDRELSRIPKKRVTRVLKKSRKVRRLLRTYIRKSIPKSSRMHLFTNKVREKIYAHGIRCENIGTPWLGCSKLGWDNPGLVWNPISDLKALKENSVEFFLSRVWLFDALKRTLKIFPKRL